MNSINISVRIDQKAALLAGRVLDKTALVECSPESIGDQWPALVGMINMHVSPPTLDVTVDDPTAEAVRAALLERAAARVEEIRVVTAGIEAMDTASRQPMTPEKQNASTFESALYGYQFDGFTRSLGYTALYESGLGAEAYAELTARRDEITSRNDSELADANRDAFNSAAPNLRAEKAETDAADEAKKLAADVEKKAANVIKFAARLKNGYWEKETGSYNEKRYGTWWCATVDFSVGAKSNYEFGEASGSWGKAGTLRVKCAPGDFIAYGQKDLRRPDRSDHTLLRMRADGGMESFDSKAAAYKAYRESQKVTA